MNYFIAIGSVSLAGLVLYRNRVAICKQLVSLFRQEDLIPIQKNVYELSYVHKGKPYRLMLRSSARPKLITHVTTAQGEDVTGEVMPILGPNQDFHSQLYLPDGLHSLIYHTRHGTTKTFHQMFGLEN